MTVTRKNLWVRMAFFGNPPSTTSLCALFWRGCVVVPVLLGLAGVGVAAIVVQFYMYLRLTLIGIGGFALFAGFCFTAGFTVYFVIGLFNGNEEVVPPFVMNSVPYQGFIAVKRRYLCPMIEIR